ncbi:flagellar motor switch protein FliM [Aminithiophilus ramosus]|uniref:Flagellar motor switch protein FliM n=2 Tax=Synergistales TaxID=649776 RepID=A0A9Q7AKX0_9BACT|nr:flagellar motor switch protein FliM [Aminithiophilus ramosus]QTX31657.1 flagellar motor switch protein FliM [Aminithiophilus ramosus]QVL35463.1 flagellar motor switch protein FliM [Synergistota bacterium]
MVPEVLSQSEIDNLLSALTSGEVDAEAISRAHAEKKIKTYDFRRPDKFSKDQLRAIQMIHDAFARQMTTSLSTMVRSMVSVEVASVDQMSYDEFVRSLVQPTVIAVLEMYPFNGNAVLEINPSIVFTIIDRMLGGKGESILKPRDLTDIEQTVVERVLMRILELMEESWSTVVDIRFRFESMESNPFFVQICPATDMVLLVTLKLEIAGVQGIMNLCIPYFVMEPMIDKLSSQHWFASTGRKDGAEARPILEKKIRKIRVPLALELGRVTLTVDDILQLQPGQVIRLDQGLDDPIRVLVGKEVKYLARPGLSRGNFAAEITGLVPTDPDEEGSLS